MIKAVLFDRKAFTHDAIERICRETGGHYGGALIDPAMANCLESFPNGEIHFSVSSGKNKEVINCKGDMEKFIHVNSKYGPQRKEEVDETAIG